MMEYSACPLPVKNGCAPMPIAFSTLFMTPVEGFSIRFHSMHATGMEMVTGR